MDEHLSVFSNFFFFFFKPIVHYDTSAMKRCQENVFRTSIVRNFILRGMKMRISAREACVKSHLRTRSDIKIYI